MENNTALFWSTIIFIIILIMLIKLRKSEENKNIEKYKSIISEQNIIYPQFQEKQNADTKILIMNIQEFYPYNPQTYEDLIEELDNFVSIYNQTIFDPHVSGTNYNLLNDKKRLLLNILNSLVYSLPSSIIYEKKLQTAELSLNIILNAYLNTIMKLFKQNIKQNGYSVSTQLPNTGPMAFNDADDHFIY